MNFGLLLTIRNPQQWHRPDHDVYRGWIDNAVAAEKYGYSHIWTSEHHFLPDGWSPAQLPILAAIAARTERIRLGTFVFLLAMHNPIRAAEDAATVDIISNGRLDLACGPGGNPDEFAVFGVPFKQRKSRMYEGLEIIKRCFNEDSFNWSGKYYNFENLRMTTKPVQKPFPLWVAALGDQALAEAGAHGYHLASAPTAEKQRIYDDALREAGHDPKNFQRSQHKICHVAETSEKAWDEAEKYLHYYMSVHFRMISQTPAGTARTEDPRFPGRTDVPPIGELRKTRRGPYGPSFIGSPEDVINQLDEEFKTHPMNECSPTLGLPGMDPRIARKSMELFAREVIPHFKNAGVKRTTE